MKNIAHLEMENCQRTLNLTNKRDRERVCKSEREREAGRLGTCLNLQLSEADIHKMQNSKDTFGQRNANRERRIALAAATFSSDHEKTNNNNDDNNKKWRGPQSKRHQVPSPSRPLSPTDPPYFFFSLSIYVCLNRSSVHMWLCGVSFVDAVANGCIRNKKRYIRIYRKKGLSSHSGTSSGRNRRELGRRAGQLMTWRPAEGSCQFLFLVNN